MSKSRAYCAINVQSVCVQSGPWEDLSSRPQGHAVHVGVDVSKAELQVVLRWSDGTFQRPICANNPGQIGVLVKMLKCIGEG